MHSIITIFDDLSDVKFDKIKALINGFKFNLYLN